MKNWDLGPEIVFIGNNMFFGFYLEIKSRSKINFIMFFFNL